MTAHDVRHLTICPRCRHLGDKRTMVHVGEELVHGACVVPAEIMSLPLNEQDKLTLSDIGLDMMRALLEDRTR